MPIETNIERIWWSSCRTAHARVEDGGIGIEGSTIWLTKDEALELAKFIMEEFGASETEPEWIEWIEWTGGECPLPNDAVFDVKFRDGFVIMRETHPAGVRWQHNGEIGDIIAYRIAKDD